MTGPARPNLLQRLAGWRLFVVLLVLYGITDFLLLHGFGAMPKTGMPPLDLLLHYSPEQVQAYLGGLGPQGRAATIRAHATLDLAYPLVYSSLFAVMITMLTRALGLVGRPWRLLALAPFAILAFDLAENAAIITLALRYPAPMTGLAHAASLFTTLKWAFAALVIGASVLLALAALAKTLKRRMSR